MKDLAQFNSSVTRGASYGEQWDKAVVNRVLSPHTVASPEQTLMMAAHGRVDFTPMNLYTGMYLMRELKLEGMLGINDKPIHFSAYHMAFSKKSPHRHLLPAINKAIAELRAEHFAENLLKSYQENQQAWGGRQ